MRAGSAAKLSQEASQYSLEFLDYTSALRLIAALLGDGRCAILRASEAGLQPADQLEFSHWLCRAGCAPQRSKFRRQQERAVPYCAFPGLVCRLPTSWTYLIALPRLLRGKQCVLTCEPTELLSAASSRGHEQQTALGAVADCAWLHAGQAPPASGSPAAPSW